MKVPEQTPGDHYVRSLARGLAVIRSFSAETPRQTLAQVAVKAGLDRAGARRILLTLESLGYVRREGRNFFPTPAILHLGYSYLSTVPSWRVAERAMFDLVDAVKESASLGVLTKSDVVSVACVNAHHSLTVNLVVGFREPAYCAARGRILLGALPETDLIRVLKEWKRSRFANRTTTSISKLVQIVKHDWQKGWSFVSSESLCGIAVPVFSPSGQLTAAMGVVGLPTSTGRQKMVETILPRLQQTAKTLWDGS
jgi:IclR family pca regulon transcriptional regulator